MSANHSLRRYADLDQNGYRSTYRSSVCTIGCETAQGIHSASAQLQVAQVGGIGILKLEESGLIRGWRNQTQIREDKIDDFLFVFPLSAPVALTQSGRTGTVQPGAMVLVSTDQPFEGICGSHNYAEISVRVSGPALRKRVTHIDECCAIPIDTQRGGGRVMRTLIETLLDESLHHASSNLAHFEEVVLGSVEGLIHASPQLLDLQDHRPFKAHERVLSQALRFMEDHLTDPKLGPTKVADHCRISLSYLHAAFAAHDLSVSDCIRQQRVERIRDAMGNLMLNHRTLTELALQWGFNSYAAFGRAWHARFGTAPSTERTRLQANPH